MEGNPGVTGQDMGPGAAEENLGLAEAEENIGQAVAETGERRWNATNKDHESSTETSNHEVSENRLEAPEELAASHHEPESAEQLDFAHAQHENSLSEQLAPEHSQPEQHLAPVLCAQEQPMQFEEPQHQMETPQQDDVQSGVVFESQVQPALDHDDREPPEHQLADHTVDNKVDGAGETSAENE